VEPVYLFNWGRYANPLHGDAYTPQCWTCSGSCDSGGVPGRDSCPAGPNPDHTELYNEFSQGFPFRIHVPPGYLSDEVWIEILDPDGYNQPEISGGVVTIEYVDGNTEQKAVDCNPDPDISGEDAQRRACVMETDDDPNPYWFLRMDENWSFVAPPSTYDPGKATETEYRLYYHKQLADQSIIKDYLGTYVGGADDSSTDLQWVPAWKVDVNCEPDGNDCHVPDIVVSEDGSFSLYLEVDGVSGWSMNGFDLWAGAPYTDSIPTNVNDRNLYLRRNPWSHDPGGLVTFGSGYLPLHTNVPAPELITQTFAFIPPEAVGVGMNLFHFDNGDGRPVDYYLEGVEAWHYQGTLSLDGTWSTSANYEYQPPGSRDHDSVAIPDEFYGGYLKAKYQSKFRDNSCWHLEYEGVVGDVFVRLIQ